MTRFDMQEWIAHYGIMGQRWGIRNYQNLDGSLTAAGRQRYGGSARAKAKMYNQGLKSAVWNSRRMQIGSQKAGEHVTKLTTKRNKVSSAADPNDGKAQKKVAKLDKKIAKAITDYENSKRMQSVGKKEVDRILSMAISEGYNITATNKTRTRTSGKDLVQAILYGSPAFRTTTAEEYKVRKTRYSIV